MKKSDKSLRSSIFLGILKNENNNFKDLIKKVHKLGICQHFGGCVNTSGNVKRSFNVEETVFC